MIREGFEPAKFNPVSNSDFAVGDDDDKPVNVGKMQQGSEEAQEWGANDGEEASGQSSATGEQRYGSLDDRNVWGSKDGHA